MGRFILAAFVGTIVAFVIIAGIEMISHELYPLPDGMDPTDQESLAAHMQNVPSGALIMVVLAHALGMLAGIWVSAKIARVTKIPSNLVIVFVSLATLANLFLIPHPTWFMAADLIGITIAAIIGNRLFLKDLI